MTSRTAELVAIPFRAMRRAILWWAVGLAAIVAATVAFWPAFQGSSGISQAIDQLPSGIVEAFGLQDFGSPAGFLRGNLYELLIPLLLSLAAIALVNGQTAGEESSGRLELVLAQPVGRRPIFAGRAVAVLIALLVITIVLAATQLVSDAVVGLSIQTGYLMATIVLCALLGVLYGSLAFAVAGLFPRPSLVLGIGVAVAVGGYLVAALFPLSSVLAPWRHLSPWDWALGGDPLGQATEAWRYVALVVPSLILVAVGLVGVERRDVEAP
jgi:ABC-2 type transport system permease protein